MKSYGDSIRSLEKRRNAGVKGFSTKTGVVAPDMSKPHIGTALSISSGSYGKSKKR